MVPIRFAVNDRGDLSESLNKELTLRCYNGTRIPAVSGVARMPQPTLERTFLR